MKAARYLNWRINRSVSLEDKTLIDRVQAGMGSSSYTVGPLGTTEVCLRSFGRRLRGILGLWLGRCRWGRCRRRSGSG